LIVRRGIGRRNLICSQFESVFTSYGELIEYVTHLARNRPFRSGSLTLEGAGEGKISELEASLAELYRKKEQNDQQLIETNNRLAQLRRDYEAQVIMKEEFLKENQSLKKDLEQKVAIIAKLTESNQLLKDEFFALQASYTSIEERCRRAEEERNDLIERLKDLKEKQIRFFNEQNERETEERRRRMQSDIEAAVSNIPQSGDDKAFEIIGAVNDQAASEFIGDIIPTKCAAKFECHDGEVNDVLWFPTGQYFATGGSDRKVRLFEMVNGKHEKKATLSGCNGSVMRIDFNLETRQVLAAGTDFAIRIWGVDDLRSKHSLTGHGDKVSTAKFYMGGVKVVSGSHDRTIKIWDLSTRKCAKTFFPGSTVLDIVSNDKQCGMIISGHFDKKVRMWDARSEEPVSMVQFGGKVTSVAISSDCLYLLCSSRDETLSLVDLRNYQVIHIYSAEQYRTSCDYSRCVISPGMEYCAAGSTDGHIFIWNTHTTKLEKTLSKGGHDRPVLSLSWHPKGHMLLSSDRQKTVCLWTS
uniref:Autophagy-related protein 16 domain-containing protein n=1 Tax=Parascaris univalens TaxID=6257 RepID=A0A915A685_PARUN